jgi:hypothetical protein
LDFSRIASPISILNLNCLPFDPSGLLHCVLKWLEFLLPQRIVRARCVSNEHANVAHPSGLLTVRYMGPSGDQATEKRNEYPPPHSLIAK